MCAFYSGEAKKVKWELGLRFKVDKKVVSKIFYQNKVQPIDQLTIKV